MNARRRPTKRPLGKRKAGKGPVVGTKMVAVAALVVFAGLVLALAWFGGEGSDSSGTKVVATVPVQTAPAPPRTAAPPVPSKTARLEPRRPQAAPVPPSASREQPTAAPALTPPAPIDPPVQQLAAVRPPLPNWKRDGGEAVPSTGRPRIVVVIDDMGLDRRRSERIAALPGPLTLAWLPYAKDLRAQTKAARAAGHEMIVHVPMEPDGSNNPGPNALLTGLPEDEIRRRLDINLSAFDGYVGINNHMGSRFTADRAGMSVVLTELSSRGLLFLDSKTTAVSVAGSLAVGLRLPIAVRDVFLDHEQTPTFLRQALAKVEATARQDGLAIAIGHPHDVTAAALAAWLPTLEQKGFQLIPISAAARVQRPAS